MIKDSEYFRSLNLQAAKSRISELGDERGESEVFGDVLTAFSIISEERIVESSEVRDILGPPDEVKKIENGEVWEYHWTDFHGPNKYSSMTPFVIVDGICKGLLEDDEQ